MIKVETYEAVVEENALDSPLRNIRVHLNGTEATVDLVPSVVLDKPSKTIDPDIPTDINKVLAGSRPIIESNSFMRVYFDGILAIAIQEEFIEIIEILNKNLKSAPRLSDGCAPYPFLRVVNSEWKYCLPDYQGRGDPNLTHFKIVSMETCVDILGCIEKTEWLDN